MPLYERNEQVRFYGNILPPTKERVDEYIKELRKYPQKIGNIFVLLCGGYINHPGQTQDLDFVLYDPTNDREKYQEIGRFMNWAMELGIVYNLWIDMVLHIDECWNFDKNPKKFMKMSTYHYLREDGVETWRREHVNGVYEDELPKKKQVMRHSHGMKQDNYPQLVAII